MATATQTKKIWCRPEAISNAGARNGKTEKHLRWNCSMANVKSVSMKERLHRPSLHHVSLISRRRQTSLHRMRRVSLEEGVTRKIRTVGESHLRSLKVQMLAKLCEREVVTQKTEFVNSTRYCSRMKRGTIMMMFNWIEFRVLVSLPRNLSLESNATKCMKKKSWKSRKLLKSKLRILSSTLSTLRQESSMILTSASV